MHRALALCSSLFILCTHFLKHWVQLPPSSCPCSPVSFVPTMTTIDSIIALVPGRQQLKVWVQGSNESQPRLYRALPHRPRSTQASHQCDPQRRSALPLCQREPLAHSRRQWQQACPAMAMQREIRGGLFMMFQDNVLKRTSPMDFTFCVPHPSAGKYCFQCSRCTKELHSQD